MWLTTYIIYYYYYYYYYHHNQCGATGVTSITSICSPFLLSSVARKKSVSVRSLILFQVIVVPLSEPSQHLFIQKETKPNEGALSSYILSAAAAMHHRRTRHWTGSWLQLHPSSIVSSFYTYRIRNVMLSYYPLLGLWSVHSPRRSKHWNSTCIYILPNPNYMWNPTVTFW